MTTIVVLDDGETWSEITGCRIVEVPDNMGVDEVSEYLRFYDPDPANSRYVGTIWTWYQQLIRDLAAQLNHLSIITPIEQDTEDLG